MEALRQENMRLRSEIEPNKAYYDSKSLQHCFTFSLLLSHFVIYTPELGFHLYVQCTGLDYKFAIIGSYLTVTFRGEYYFLTIFSYD